MIFLKIHQVHYDSFSCDNFFLKFKHIGKFKYSLNIPFFFLVICFFNVLSDFLMHKNFSMVTSFLFYKFKGFHCKTNII